jgi:hypothetical protein
MIFDHRLHNLAQIDGCIRVEYYGRFVHKNQWKTEAPHNVERSIKLEDRFPPVSF